MITGLFGNGNVTPLLDGRTPVFIEVGADPRVAPGLDMPMGSIACFGTLYLEKIGSGATDWQPISIVGSAQPSGVASFDMALSDSGGIAPLEVIGFFIPSANGVLRHRFNGAAATRQAAFFHNLTTGGVVSSVGDFLGARPTGNHMRASICGDANQAKLSIGLQTSEDGPGVNASVELGGAVLATGAAAFTSVGFALSVGTFSAGSFFYVRRLRRP